MDYPWKEPKELVALLIEKEEKNKIKEQQMLDLLQMKKPKKAYLEFPGPDSRINEFFDKEGIGWIWNGDFWVKRSL